MRILVLGAVLGLGLLAACAPKNTLSRPAELLAPVDTTRSSRTQNTLYLINGRALARGHSVRELDRTQIVSVEHFIGLAALWYGVGSDSDVVVITTNDSVAALWLTTPRAQDAAVTGQLEATPLIVINGRVMLPGHDVREPDARAIVSVDVYKGSAAHLIGSAQGQPAIVVSTRDWAVPGSVDTMFRCSFGIGGRAWERDGGTRGSSNLRR